MTMIRDTFRDPAGTGVAGVEVRASLVAASEVVAGGGAVIREAQTTTAGDGTWTLTLTPIGDLAVSGGAYYLVTADGHRWAVDVPDSGTYTLDDVQVEPGPLPATGATVGQLPPAASVGVAGLVTPPGGTAEFLRADATWAVPPSGGGGAVYSRQIVIACDGVASDVTPPVGVWVPQYLAASDTGGVWSGWLTESDGVQGSALSWDFECDAGTYEIELRHLALGNRGIYTVEIDGTGVGTVDGYNDSDTPTRSVLTGVPVDTAGQHVLTLLMATKNGASTGYYGLVDRATLTRTA